MKKNIEPLKYLKKAVFASFAFAGGISIYVLGKQAEDLPMQATGLAFAGWATYETLKNCALSIKSNFKNNLESRIK